MMRLLKLSSAPRQPNSALAGDLFASSSRFLGRRYNHTKAAALPSGDHFLPELEDFEKAQEAFLHLSRRTFQDFNVSDLRFCSECIKSFGSEVWNAFLAPFNIYHGHWVLNILTILFIALISYTLLILTPRQ